jgi:hypothetical protein|tara:strand:+ start:738 stop:1535 length:798 start_codon:yes stop_codon:yes gene_type:complete
MKISILVPTRERMNHRLTLIFSILSTVDDINNVDIYFGVDKDDPTLETIKKIAAGISCLKIVEIENNGEFLGLGKLWNILAETSDAEIISMINDDYVFKTQGWDTMLLEEFASMPEDKIQAIHCNDEKHGKDLPVNLFCHRKYAEVLGQFMRPEFTINWVDQWLHQMFLAFDRIKYREDYTIEHRHWLYGKRGRDTTAERMAKADTTVVNNQPTSFSDNLWHQMVDERIEDVKKLAAHIKQEPNWSVVDTGDKIVNYENSAVATN